MNSIHSQATALGLAFEEKGVRLSRSEKLETIARIQGFKDFNTAVASETTQTKQKENEFKTALRDLVYYTLSRGRKPASEVQLPAIGSDAPGHCHRKQGIWDADNGALAGKECLWCKSWNAALSLIQEDEKA